VQTFLVIALGVYGWLALAYTRKRTGSGDCNNDYHT